MALHFYNIAGVGINGEVLKTVARKVIRREISDHVVDVVVTLFDENEVISFMIYLKGLCLFVNRCSLSFTILYIPGRIVVSK